MSFPPLPVDQAAVYNFVVLMQFSEDGNHCARSANLPLPDVWANDARDAMMELVRQAKELIKDCVARDRMIPWIEPPLSPSDTESRFLIPIHL